MSCRRLQEGGSLAQGGMRALSRASRSESAVAGLFACVGRGDGLVDAGGVADARRGDGLVVLAVAGGSRRGALVSGPLADVTRGDGLTGGAAAGFSQRGYSLLEVIVAFAVLGVALSLLLGALSGGTRQVRWAADSGRAVLHAQSLLDEVGVGEVLVPGRRDGEFGGGRYRWVLDVAPYVDRDRPPVPLADPYAPQLLQLRLVVTWGEGGPRERLQLDTLRLVQPDPSGLSG